MKRALLKTLATATLAVTTVALLRAADGVLIVQTVTSGTSVTSTQTQIEKNRLRTEVSDASGGTQVVVFDGAKQTLYNINMSRKTYTEISKAELDKMSAQANEMMSKMSEQLAALPPAQRAQMQAMMQGRGGPAAAPPKTEYRKTGADRVGRWTCDKYQGFQNGQKTSEICTVAPAALGLNPGDIEVSIQFGNFFRGLMPQSADSAFTVGQAEVQGFSGVPVRTVSISATRQTTREITEITRQTFADSLFAIPAGFQKETIGGRGRY